MTSRDVTEILEDTIAIAEDQIEAAKMLNVSALNEATQARQELLFELEVAMANAGSTSIDVSELSFQLEELDRRLNTLLSAGLAALERIRSGAKPETYTHEGRLKRGHP